MKIQKLQKGMLALSLVLCNLVKAQDIMTLRDGNDLAVKVTEINETEIKYKDFKNLDGPIRVIYKSDVFSIKYENGVKSVFNTEHIVQQTNTVEYKPAENQGKVYDKDTSDFAKIRRKSFSGPRIGFTYITSGTSADYLAARGKNQGITQFGWQFEGRLFTVEGFSGLIEFVPLIGGMEQGIIIPSASCLLGLRSSGKTSFEFALGPNFSISPNYKGDTEGAVGLVLAAGTSFKKGNINFPINIAVVPSIGSKHDIYDVTTKTTTSQSFQTGWRISLLVGFNYRKK